MEQALLLSIICVCFLFWTYSFLAGEWESHKQRVRGENKKWQ